MLFITFSIISCPTEGNAKYSHARCRNDDDDDDYNDDVSFRKNK
jgi:hypothetical protein